MPEPAADRKSNRDKAYVYHLSHIDNMASIAQHGLLSRQALSARRVGFTDVANPEILNGRSDHGLDAFVPFHFIHLSPFDGAVVAAAQDKRFVLFAVRRTLARQQGWVIVPQHPLANGGPPEILSWDEGFDRIEWDQMDKFPRRYDLDHHCKMVCMAEALAPGVVPLASVAAVYAPTQAVLELARERLGRPPVHFNLTPAMFPPACR